MEVIACFSWIANCLTGFSIIDENLYK
jgi:hypothetical protein